MRQKDNPEFYEDTIEYQHQVKGEGQGIDSMFVPPEEDEKSTNS